MQPDTNPGYDDGICCIVWVLCYRKAVDTLEETQKEKTRKVLETGGINR